MTVRSCTKSEKRISKQTKGCDGCKKPGNLVKCDIASCDATTHIYCALRGIVEIIQKKDEPKVWSYKLGNQENPVKVYLDPEDTMLKDGLESAYVKLDKISKKLSGESEEQVQEIEPDGDSRNNSAVKKKRGSQKKIKGQDEELENIKMLTEDEEAVIIGINEEIKDKLRDLLKGLPQGNNLKGGEFILQCKNHKIEELYCVCNLPYDNGRAMVGCDCCSKEIIYIKI